MKKINQYRLLTLISIVLYMSLAPVHVSAEMTKEDMITVIDYQRSVEKQDKKDDFIFAGAVVIFALATLILFHFLGINIIDRG